MRRFLKYTVIFFLLFFIVEKSAWFLLDATPKRQYDKRLELLLNGEISKDLIILGSSRGAGNILAGQLQDETGLTSFNLSYQGSDVTFHKFILETLIAYNEAPKHILLNIDNPSEFTDSTSVIFRVDALSPLTKYNYINNTLINKGVNNRLSHLFFLSRLNKSHFRFKNQKPSSVNPLDSFGSMPLLKKKSAKLTYIDKSTEYNKNSELSYKLQAFKEIQNICKHNNIQLSYVFAPDFKSFNSSFYNRFKKLIDNENHIFVYDTLNPIYKNESFYFDSAHLLKNGAEIFTSAISEFINNKLVE